MKTGQEVVTPIDEAIHGCRPNPIGEIPIKGKSFTFIIALMGLQQQQFHISLAWELGFNQKLLAF
ncbi:MAG: hypothetical protein HOF22_09865 [Verrucomicrobia bacterium]|nr:hypothetical protein [Verrucomicrobiota bacterium]